MDSSYLALGGILEFNTNVNVKGGGEVEFNYILEQELEEDDLSKEYMRRLIIESCRIIRNSNLFKREIALENYRQLYFPNQISRMHAMWLSEKKSLEYWRHHLSLEGRGILFEVSATGKAFKTSDCFFPKENANYLECFNAAERYWKPKFDGETDSSSTEYLFEGKVKVLKKLNIDTFKED